jgi:hypothetical protein
MSSPCRRRIVRNPVQRPGQARAGDAPQGRRRSLEETTKSPCTRGQVRLRVYPKCGEAVVSLLQRERAAADRSRKGERAHDPQRCRENAARRAKSTFRRFCKQHRLCFMWTLTYGDGGQRDLAQLRRQVERLRAKVIRETGRDFPYAYVVEFHKDGERLHVHMAVPFFFDQRRLTTLWGHGHVWCSDKRQRGECRFIGAERAVRYMAKYMAKAFEDGDFGRHRYERARGWAVETYDVRVFDFGDGQRVAEEVFGGKPRFVLDSADVEDWQAPPMRLLFFEMGAPDG